MGDILYLIALLLLLGWLVGFIGFSEAVGSFIHILLILAIIVLLIRIITGRRPM